MRRILQEEFDKDHSGELDGKELDNLVAALPQVAPSQKQLLHPSASPKV